LCIARSGKVCPVAKDYKTRYISRKTEPKRMTIEGFLEQYKLHNWYVVTIMPNVMRKDLRVNNPVGKLLKM